MYRSMQWGKHESQTGVKHDPAPKRAVMIYFTLVCFYSEHNSEVMRKRPLKELKENGLTPSSVSFDTEQ